MFVDFLHPNYILTILFQNQVLEWQQSDEMWSREGAALHDPFHLVFIRGAFQDTPWMKHAVFGLGSHACSLLPSDPEHNDPISELFEGYSKF